MDENLFPRDSEYRRKIDKTTSNILIKKDFTDEEIIEAVSSSMISSLGEIF